MWRHGADEPADSIGNPRRRDRTSHDRIRGCQAWTSSVGRLQPVADRVIADRSPEVGAEGIGVREEVECNLRKIVEGLKDLLLFQLRDRPYDLY